jgi:hypothetical protein
MVALALGLAVFRSIYLDAVPASVLPHDAAAVLYDTIVRFLRLGLRTVLVLALVVAAGAFLSGQSVTALRIGAVALACLALVFWGRPTGKVVLGLTLALLVALAIIEVLGQPPKTVPPSGEEELVSRAT